MAHQDVSELSRMLRLCERLKLPEIAQGTSYGAPSVQVRGKNFASVRGPNEIDRKSVV